MKKIFFISALILFIDQLIKGLCSYFLDFGSSFVIIKDFLDLILIQNTGAAFNIMSGNTIILIILGIIVLCGIYFLVVKDHNLSKTETITYGVLVGGILGNLVDRIFNGYVIDYIHFSFLGYSFPVFNFADACIVITVIIIIIDIFRRKNEIQSK